MLTLKEKIAVIVGSRSDLKTIRLNLNRLKARDVPFKLYVASVARLDELVEWIGASVKQGVEVFIVAQGGTATLAGLVASKTQRPVIGVPLDTTRHRGTDAQLAMSGLNDGCDILLSGVNEFDSAARSAMKMIALADPDYQVKVEEIYEQLLEKQRRESNALREEYGDLFASVPATIAPEHTFVPPREDIEAAKTEEQEGQPLPELDEDKVPTPGSAYIYNCDADMPNVTVIENATDALLRGDVVAFPTETVYGLAVDATNKNAVAKLLELKGRESNNPLTIMVNSDKQLFQIASDIPEVIKEKIDYIWPGPLTLVFQKPAASFNHISADDTIGIRIPNHFTALSLLSSVNRPLAVTSANPSGYEDARTAQGVENYFPTGTLAMIIDSGPCGSSMPSTVLKVTSEPFEILREGAMTRSHLQEILGDLVQ